jgi:uncharacterized protein with PQ loop repeat
MQANGHTIAATILGLIGTIFWCIQLMPQIYYNWRRKCTDGLPALMMMLWAVCTFASQKTQGTVTTAS